jgi:cohesin complex subunit SA-1/2
MPARDSSMDLSSPANDAQSTATRRKSGRVVKQPETLAASSTKRKRPTPENEDAEGEDEDASEGEEDSDESEPDEEELRERRKRTKKQSNAKKPVPKKAKQANGEPVRLAIRPAAPKKARKAKPQHKVADAESVGGLYGMSCSSAPSQDSY